MQKTIKRSSALSKLMSWMVEDAYVALEPQKPSIAFSFSQPKISKPKAHVEKNIAAPQPVPPATSNIVEKITTGGMQKRKMTEQERGFEIEIVGKKSLLVTEAEMSEILNKYPSIDKNAVVATKKGWCNNLSTERIVVELKKQNLKCGSTYVRFICSVFNKGREAER